MNLLITYFLSSIIFAIALVLTIKILDRDNNKNSFKFALFQGLIYFIPLFFIGTPFINFLPFLALLMLFFLYYDLGILKGVIAVFLLGFIHQLCAKFLIAGIQAVMPS